MVFPAVKIKWPAPLEVPEQRGNKIRSQVMFLRLKVIRKIKTLMLSIIQKNIPMTFMKPVFIPGSSPRFCRWKGTSCHSMCPPERVLSATSCSALARTHSRGCSTTLKPSGTTTPRPRPTCSATSLPWRPGPFRVVPTH